MEREQELRSSLEGFEKNDDFEGALNAYALSARPNEGSLNKLVGDTIKFNHKRLFIKAFNSIEHRAGISRVFMVEATRYNRLDMLKQLFDKDSKLERGFLNKLMHQATMCGHLDIVKYYVQKGADLAHAKEVSGQYSPADGAEDVKNYFKAISALKEFLDTADQGANLTQKPLSFLRSHRVRTKNTDPVLSFNAVSFGLLVNDLDQIMEAQMRSKDDCLKPEDMNQSISPLVKLQDALTVNLSKLFDDKYWETKSIDGLDALYKCLNTTHKENVKQRYINTRALMCLMQKSKRAVVMIKRRKLRS